MASPGHDIIPLRTPKARTGFCISLRRPRYMSAHRSPLLHVATLSTTQTLERGQLSMDETCAIVTSVGQAHSYATPVVSDTALLTLYIHKQAKFCHRFGVG
jgi:hypothetical protein